MILARVGDKKQNKTVNMAEIVFFRGVSENTVRYISNKTMLIFMESTIIILN